MTHTLDYRSHFISARDGLKLHVRDYGTAGELLPVVCLPGLARNSADFHELALSLSGDPKRPRRVIALDYRGRGRSEYDKTWTNYDIKIELDDVLQVLAATGIHEAVFVGTSRGGLITMSMAPVRPTFIKGVVLNDIGPVLDAQGLIRIRGYVGKLPAPRTWHEAADILKQVFGPQFPILDRSEWLGYARRTWKDDNGRLVPDYDTALMKTLEALDLEAPLPVLWPFFDGLKHAPMLVLRGANSDLLSDETLRAMKARHPACETFTVAGQGHAPLLTGKDVLSRIARLCVLADDARH
ncbi:MAG: alpha/beta fold hydrolase [Bosea sp. (in: a-proteobacteria)]